MKCVIRKRTDYLLLRFIIKSIIIICIKLNRYSLGQGDSYKLREFPTGGYSPRAVVKLLIWCKSKADSIVWMRKEIS